MSRNLRSALRRVGRLLARIAPRRRPARCDLPAAPRLRRDMGLPEAPARLRPSVFAPQAYAFRHRA